MPEPETKDTQDGSQVPPVAPLSNDRKLTLAEAEEIAQRVLDRGVASRYVECPQCRVLVLRTDPICYRDRIVYDAEGQKWYPLDDTPAEPAAGDPVQAAEDSEDGDILPGIL